MYLRGDENKMFIFGIFQSYPQPGGLDAVILGNTAGFSSYLNTDMLFWPPRLVTGYKSGSHSGKTSAPSLSSTSAFSGGMVKTSEAAISPPLIEYVNVHPDPAPA